MINELVPIQSGLLQVSKLHKINYATFGNPKGVPLLCFHGGPGGGFKTKYTSLTDMEKYYAIMFDQRGCGKSEPIGEIRENKCKYAMKDAKTLLDHLSIKKCVVMGFSYGSTLALAFAAKNPSMIFGLFASSVFVPINFNDWFYGDGAKNILPKEYAEFMSVLKTSDAKKLFNKYENSPAAQKKEMAAALVTWELELFKGLNSIERFTSAKVDDAMLASKRVFLYYTAHNMFNIGPWIMKNINKIKGLPITIIHGSLDFVSPISVAYGLKKKLPHMRLIDIPDAGHVGKIITTRLYKEMNKASW
jgi:proline iminopeptidase